MSTQRYIYLLQTKYVWRNSQKCGKLIKGFIIAYIIIDSLYKIEHNLNPETALAVRISGNMLWNHEEIKMIKVRNNQNSSENVS